MNKEELKIIIDDQKKIKELPNKVLINHMDRLSSEFSKTKDSIVNLTHYLDNLKILYDKILDEYNNRK